MKLIYTDILPVGLEDDQQSIIDCFREQILLVNKRAHSDVRPFYCTLTPLLLLAYHPLR